MARLTSQQWEAIYEGTLRVLRTETVSDFATESLAALVALIPCKQCMLFTFDRYVPGAVEFGPVFQYGSTVHYIDAFVEGPYMEEDWIFSRMNLKATDCAYRDSDIIDEESLVKLKVYQDIYAKDGVHWGMRVNMVSDNTLVGSFSIFRSKEAGDFSDQEIEACDKLAHLFSAHYGRLRQAGRADGGLSRVDAMDHYGLTLREYQIAEAYAQGCADDEVAARLSISAATAKKHLYNAYAKLGVNKRSQLEELFAVN